MFDIPDDFITKEKEKELNNLIREVLKACDGLRADYVILLLQSFIFECSEHILMTALKKGDAWNPSRLWVIEKTLREAYPECLNIMFKKLRSSKTTVN